MGNLIQYKQLTDKELVAKIVTLPYDEDAAVYMIYDRYTPIWIKVTLNTFDNSLENLGDLQSELYLILKGKELDWHPLRSFQWRSTLGSWLKVIAYNLSLALKRKLIENSGQNVSISNMRTNKDNDNTMEMDIPVDEEAARERKYRMVLLQEAIHRLENPDQRFVVFKRLQGFSSKEIATLLNQHWKKMGIRKYNNKHELVIADSGYIDNLFKRGYEKTKLLFSELDR